MSLPFTVGRLVLFCTFFAAVGNVAVAQVESPPRPGTVHATGQYELKLKPQKLRVTIAIKAQGADAKSAIEAFLAHKARVKKELVAMKADESSIEFGATQVSGGMGAVPAEMQAYEARLIAQVARAAPNIKPADIPKIYRAMARARAEWALPTADPDALALLPATLEEQIKARDLMGDKNKAKLEARQQEKLEEVQTAMQENMGYPSSGEETAPFVVAFVAKVDNESRRKALKAAYDRAVAEARLLATASGHKTGDLVTLRSSDMPSSGPGEPNYAYMNTAAAFAVAGFDGYASDEAQSASSSELKFNTRVDVEFALVK